MATQQRALCSGLSFARHQAFKLSERARRMNNVVSYAALTDIGCRRQNNEDSFGYDETARIFVVSDGMGGAAAGEVASQTAVAETVSSFAQMLSASGDGAFPVQDLLYHAVKKANRAVYETSQREPEMSGMGATLVAACLDGRRVIIANVGDSRAYLLRNGQCTQITEDHSLVAEQVKLGLMTPEAAARSPLATSITRAIGINPDVEPDLFGAELLPGDRLLLTTDGLMRHLADVEIGLIVGESQDLRTACTLLIETTRQRGAIDNVTCLLLETA